MRGVEFVQLVAGLILGSAALGKLSAPQRPLTMLSSVRRVGRSAAAVALVLLIAIEGALAICLLSGIAAGTAIAAAALGGVPASG